MRTDRVGSNEVRGSSCSSSDSLIQITNSIFGGRKLPNSSELVRGPSRELKVGERVQKYGKTTGQTLGIVNPSESYIRFDDARQRITSKEIVVVGIDKNFSESGDSGSFVLTIQEELMGIVWGRFKHREGSFVTPIKAIAEDIYGMTGYRVRLAEDDEL